MVSRDVQRQRALEKIAAHILAGGLAQTSLRQLAGVAGISDRMLLYYFKDKTEVMTAALVHILAGLQDQLATALPDTQRLAPGPLFRAANALLKGPDMQPYMALWLEIAAAASRGDPLSRELANQIVAAFHAWFEARLDMGIEGTDAANRADRAGMAALLLAAVDGMSIIDTATDTGLMDQAAETLATQLGTD